MKDLTMEQLNLLTRIIRYAGTQRMQVNGFFWPCTEEVIQGEWEAVDVLEELELIDVWYSRPIVDTCLGARIAVKAGAREYVTY